MRLLRTHSSMSMAGRWAAPIVLVLSCLLIQSCTEPPARRTVIVYTSADQEYAEQIFAAFEAAHPGVLILPRFDTEATKTTGLVERLRAERGQPQADVFWSSEVFLTQKLADEGLLRTWSSAAARDWPSAYRDSSDRWYGFAARARVIAFDPMRVEQPPTHWRDLADPRFRGRVVIADPNYGTTRGHIAAWFALWGEEGATAFLHELKQNKIRVVKSNSQAVREIASGLADVALTDTDDVWAAQRNGYRVELVYPRHGDKSGEGTLLIPNTVSLVAGRPANPDAERLAEFLLSAECQALLYASDSHNLPILPEGRSGGIEIEARHRAPDPLVMEVGSVIASMDAALGAINEILLGRDR